MRENDRTSVFVELMILKALCDHPRLLSERACHMLGLIPAPRLSAEELSPLKQTSPFKQSITPSHQNNGIQSEKKGNGQNNQSKGNSIEKEEETLPATSIEGDNNRASTTDGKNATEEKEDKSKMDETKEQGEQKEGESNPDDKSTKEHRTVVSDDKEIALPGQKERVLPAWMTKAASEKEFAFNDITGVSEEVLIQESGKLVFLFKLLENLREEGHRCLVFSRSLKMLNMIEKILRTRRFRWKRLDGSIHNMIEREAIIEDFQQDDSYNLFLLTTQVGDTGLNLTGADRVVIVDPRWNPFTDNKAVDRAYRIGQTKSVIVYRLITCGTIEEKIYRRQVFKKSLIKQTTGNFKEDIYSNFTTQELRHLFELEDTEVSVTQKQLEGLHGWQRKSSRELDQHIAFLKTIVSGISDHDLLFSLDSKTLRAKLAEYDAKVTERRLAIPGSMLAAPFTVNRGNQLDSCSRKIERKPTVQEMPLLPIYKDTKICHVRKEETSCTEKASKLEGKCSRLEFSRSCGKSEQDNSSCSSSSLENVEWMFSKSKPDTVQGETLDDVIDLISTSSNQSEETCSAVEEKFVSSSQGLIGECVGGNMVCSNDSLVDKDPMPQGCGDTALDKDSAETRKVNDQADGADEPSGRFDNENAECRDESLGKIDWMQSQGEEGDNPDAKDAEDDATPDDDGVDDDGGGGGDGDDDDDDDHEDDHPDAQDAEDEKARYRSDWPKKLSRVPKENFVSRFSNTTGKVEYPQKSLKRDNGGRSVDATPDGDGDDVHDGDDDDVHDGDDDDDVDDDGGGGGDDDDYDDGGGDDDGYDGGGDDDDDGDSDDVDDGDDDDDDVDDGNDDDDDVDDGGGGVGDDGDDDDDDEYFDARSDFSSSSIICLEDPSVDMPGSACQGEPNVFKREAEEQEEGSLPKKKARTGGDRFLWLDW
ncbi:uncharacterized protein LOC135157317 [Lytechinus pictus]|uniref:uncharacterized protein LOC135157317 n=1 Tax=Lytechinus pictus TaxID=7653 RepID=UPI0030BA1757